MTESKTARASMRAGFAKEAKQDPFDTPEKKIAELRKQREAKLFVNRMDFVDALLEEYDTFVKAASDKRVAEPTATSATCPSTCAGTPL